MTMTKILLALILLLPNLTHADLLCGKKTGPYFFEFPNFGKFQAPNAYMVSIYIHGKLWAQEEGLDYQTRGVTTDGYKFGVLQTKVGATGDYEVKIKSKDGKHTLAFVKDDYEEYKISCYVRNEVQDNQLQEYIDEHFKFDPGQDPREPKRLPASSSNIFQ